MNRFAIPAPFFARTRRALSTARGFGSSLHDFGVDNLIIDPGFGFGKTLEHNYEILNNLEKFKCLKYPVLIGVSRKSMIYKLLDSDANQSLNGTSVINTIALTKGTDILRVHDVKEAVECIKIVNFAKNK